MERVVKKLAIIGINQGNGHPYSFSAIINGFDYDAMKESGWEVIFQYLLKTHNQDFLNNKMIKVEYVYTQSREESIKISKAAKIPYIVDSIDELLEQKLDGVIIALDEWKKHYKLALTFLKQNIPVFVDKPLSLDMKEVNELSYYMKQNLLMSSSGMRYARELDELRRNIKYNYEQILFIEGSIGCDWEKYLIHILDSIFGIVDFETKDVEVMRMEKFLSVFLKTDDFVIQLNSRNSSMFQQPFVLKIVTDKKSYDYTITDNFSAFRRLMGDFIEMIQGNTENLYDYNQTIKAMDILSRIKNKISEI